MDRRVFTLDRWTRRLLCVIAVLLAVIAVELWQGRPSMLPRAEAQIPDTALQRENIVREARKTNALLAQILEHLRSKPIKVEMDGTDGGDGKARKRKQIVAPASRR